METEAITLIMGALQFGVMNIAAGPLNQKGAELWDKIKTALEGNPKGQELLTEYKNEPTVSVEPLKKELIAVKAHQNEEIMALARELKELKEAQQERSSEKNVINANEGTVQGVVQENTGTNNMYFGPPPTKK